MNELNTKEVLDKLKWLFGDIIESIEDNTDAFYSAPEIVGYSLKVYLKSGKSFLLTGSEHCDFRLEIYDKPEEQDLLGR